MHQLVKGRLLAAAEGALPKQAWSPIPSRSAANHSCESTWWSAVHVLAPRFATSWHWLGTGCSRSCGIAVFWCPNTFCQMLSGAELPCRLIGAGVCVRSICSDALGVQVTIAVCDTFRAGGIEQLKTHCVCLQASCLA